MVSSSGKSWEFNLSALKGDPNEWSSETKLSCGSLRHEGPQLDSCHDSGRTSILQRNARQKHLPGFTIVVSILLLPRLETYSVDGLTLNGEIVVGEKVGHTYAAEHSIVEKVVRSNIYHHSGPWDVAAIQAYCRKNGRYNNGLVAGWAEDDSFVVKYLGRFAVAVCPIFKESIKVPEDECNVYRLLPFKVAGKHRGRPSVREIVLALVRCPDGNYLLPGWALATIRTDAYNLVGINTMNVDVRARPDYLYVNGEYVKPRYTPDSTTPLKITDE
ncbi:hypothetical protein QAD02_009073 [Eretmocerus hayati]|uniref:Uncharacterized protein n=1 Tax=Eretmocerus hayati TaxID=131215 RepID=A0ACC2NCP7_9HYME|nr:hypothetical protein QAD02_009073 [Eretmocerus hayati]